MFSTEISLKKPSSGDYSTSFYQNEYSPNNYLSFTIGKIIYIPQIKENENEQNKTNTNEMKSSPTVIDIIEIPKQMINFLHYNKNFKSLNHILNFDDKMISKTKTNEINTWNRLLITYDASKNYKLIVKPNDINYQSSINYCKHYLFMKFNEIQFNNQFNDFQSKTHFLIKRTIVFDKQFEFDWKQIINCFYMNDNLFQFIMNSLNYNRIFDTLINDHSIFNQIWNTFHNMYNNYRQISSDIQSKSKKTNKNIDVEIKTMLDELNLHKKEAISKTSSDIHINNLSASIQQTNIAIKSISKMDIILNEMKGKINLHINEIRIKNDVIEILNEKETEMEQIQHETIKFVVNSEYFCFYASKKHIEYYIKSNGPTKFIQWLIYPCCVNSHWYLLVVNVINKTMYILNSLDSSEINSPNRIFNKYISEELFHGIELKEISLKLFHHNEFTYCSFDSIYHMMKLLSLNTTNNHLLKDTFKETMKKNIDNNTDKKEFSETNSMLSNFDVNIETIFDNWNILYSTMYNEKDYNEFMNFIQWKLIEYNQIILAKSGLIMLDTSIEEFKLFEQYSLKSLLNTFNNKEYFYNISFERQLIPSWMLEII